MYFSAENSPDRAINWTSPTPAIESQPPLFITLYSVLEQCHSSTYPEAAASLRRPPVRPTAKSQQETAKPTASTQNTAGSTTNSQSPNSKTSHVVPTRHIRLWIYSPFSLGGMGAGSRIIETEDDYWTSLTPGHMWSILLHGKHYSTDIAAVTGKVVWMSHARGGAGPQQTFDYWEINVPVDPNIRQCITDFVQAHLGTFSGMLNMEIIGNKIIEIHLRFSPQWPDIYGEWFCRRLWSFIRRVGGRGRLRCRRVCIVLFCLMMRGVRG